MQPYFLLQGHYDLATPDGYIKEIKRVTPQFAEAVVRIEKILPSFVGFQIDSDQVFFNIKSTLAQLGINGVGKEYYLDPNTASAEIKVELTALGKLAITMLGWLEKGSYI